MRFYNQEEKAYYSNGVDNRLISFTQAQGDQSSIIECGYDYMGRRYTKKVTSNGTVSLHQRYIYRGYLQIACVDLTRSEHPALWYITWDPTEPVATRPLAIQKNATWYSYSHDLTKNVTELYQSDGLIATSYDYSPYGAATAEGIDQPIQYSSEYHDPELALTYYNYRHYNPTDGRWINRDPIQEDGGFNLYGFIENNSITRADLLGLVIYVLFYYSKDPLFKKVAETRQQEIENSEGFCKERDKILLTGILTEEDLLREWEKLHKATKGDNEDLQIKGLDLLIHGDKGKLYLKNSGLTLDEIKKLAALNWSEDAIVRISSCRSGTCDNEGNSVASIFASTQNVFTTGENGKAGFSEDPHQRTWFTRAGTGSDKVYLHAYGDGEPHWYGSFGTARPPIPSPSNS